MEKKKEATRGSICRRMRTTMIIVHCTATPEGRDIGMKEIRQWHVCGQGWADVGYHYLVRLDGTIESGREEHLAGAHCKGKNYCSVGVWYVGGCTADGRTAKDTRTPEQKTALRTLISQLLQRYPHATVHGHREFARKACPCFDARSEYSEQERHGNT